MCSYYLYAKSIWSYLQKKCPNKQRRVYTQRQPFENDFFLYKMRKNAVKAFLSGSTIEQKIAVLHTDTYTHLIQYTLPNIKPVDKKSRRR